MTKHTSKHEDIFVKYPELEAEIGTYKRNTRKLWTETQDELVAKLYKIIPHKKLLEYLQKEEKKGRTITVNVLMFRAWKLRNIGVELECDKKKGAKK